MSGFCTFFRANGRLSNSPFDIVLFFFFNVWMDPGREEGLQQRLASQRCQVLPVRYSSRSLCWRVSWEVIVSSCQDRPREFPHQAPRPHGFEDNEIIKSTDTELFLSVLSQVTITKLPPQVSAGHENILLLCTTEFDCNHTTAVGFL